MTSTQQYELPSKANKSRTSEHSETLIRTVNSGFNQWVAGSSPARLTIFRIAGTLVRSSAAALGSVYSPRIDKYAFHGPTASRYCFDITRTICLMWPRSWTTHVDNNCLNVTTPRSG